MINQSSCISHNQFKIHLTPLIIVEWYWQIQPDHLSHFLCQFPFDVLVHFPHHFWCGRGRSCLSTLNTQKGWVTLQWDTHAWNANCLVLAIFYSLDSTLALFNLQLYFIHSTEIFRFLFPSPDLLEIQIRIFTISCFPATRERERKIGIEFRLPF